MLSDEEVTAPAATSPGGGPGAARPTRAAWCAWLRRMGLVTGMTGDGINDAPALKKADVGFAMGSGTEVAKEAGDIVILDDNIASIAKAVLYGRTIFKNIRKFIVFQLTMNLCAVGVSIIGPFIGIDTPVTVMQMLWINIIMDTLAGLAFAGEPPLPEYMEETPKQRTEPVLNRCHAGADSRHGTVYRCPVHCVSEAARPEPPFPHGHLQRLPDDRLFRAVHLHRHLQQLQRPHATASTCWPICAKTVCLHRHHGCWWRRCSCC